MSPPLLSTGRYVKVIWSARNNLQNYHSSKHKLRSFIATIFENSNIAMPATNLALLQDSVCLQLLRCKKSQPVYYC